MTKTEIKSIFRERKVQLGVGAMEAIDDWMKRQVGGMARRCEEGNCKRLTPELMWIALGNWKEG